MNKIAYFNILPPRQEYINTVLKSLENNDLLLSQLINITKLTKTQIGCTLESLISEKKVTKIEKNGKKYYCICNIATTTEAD